MRKEGYGYQESPIINLNPRRSTITPNLVDDNLGVRAGIPTTVEHKYLYRVTHLQDP